MSGEVRLLSCAAVRRPPHTHRGTRVLNKRKLIRTFVGFRPALGDSKKDLGSGSKFSFECYQEFGD